MLLRVRGHKTIAAGFSSLDWWVFFSLCTVRLFSHWSVKFLFRDREETIDIWEFQTHVTHLVGKARILERIFHTLNRMSGCVDSFIAFRMLLFWLKAANIKCMHFPHWAVSWCKWYRGVKGRTWCCWEHSGSVLLRNRLGPQKLSSSGSGYYVVCCIFTGASD